MESIIPKKIHYCWFGNGEKPKFICDCINTWKTVLNDYESVTDEIIIEEASI